MPIRLPTRETIFVPSGEVAAEAWVVTVGWDPGKRKPVPFTEGGCGQLAAAMTR
jgi:hypothetical protein